MTLTNSPGKHLEVDAAQGRNLDLPRMVQLPKIFSYDYWFQS